MFRFVGWKRNSSKGLKFTDVSGRPETMGSRRKSPRHISQILNFPGTFGRKSHTFYYRKLFKIKDSELIDICDILIVGLSNIYLFIHTVQWCNKHIYYNHQFSIKKPPGKTSFFVAEEKSTEGQRKNTPTAAPCGLAPTQSSPPGRRSIIASTPCPYSNCLSTTLAIRAQGLHIRFWW